MYLRTRVWVIVLLALNSTAYAAMADLGGMAAENVRYAALLSTVCVLAVGVCDFLRFRRKHRLLSEICRNARLAAQNLPDCGADALEHDYQALIRAMAQDRAEAVSRMDRKMADLSAYYTLWAHQIKTPIAAMRLLLQQEGAENGELGQELFRIEQYVDMALGYVRLDSDSSDFLLRRCDLDTILRPAVRKFAPQFIRRHLTLRYEPVGKTVLTDEVARLCDRAGAFQCGQVHAGGRHCHGQLHGRACAFDLGYRHRRGAGGSAARVRAGLHRLQRPRRQKGDGTGPVSVQARVPEAWPRHHDGLARRRGDDGHDRSCADRAGA